MCADVTRYVVADGGESYKIKILLDAQRLVPGRATALRASFLWVSWGEGGRDGLSTGIDRSRGNFMRAGYRWDNDVDNARVLTRG
jgi:hypothetical protein